MPAPVVQPSTLAECDEKQRLAFLKNITAPHIESFNYAMERGLQLIPEHIEPNMFRVPSNSDDQVTVKLRIKKLSVVRPRQYEGGRLNAENANIYPRDCLLANASYVGDLLCAYEAAIDGELMSFPMKRIGRIPIMVGSSKCNLHGLSPEKLVALGEEEFELGGYFVINGSEKLMRMNIVPRVNHPISARRDNNRARGPNFTDLSLSMRCMRPDTTSSSIHLHVMKSGAVTVRVTISKGEFFLPVGLLLRALLPAQISDREIFEKMVGGDPEDTALQRSALAIIVELNDKVAKFNKADCEPHVNVSVSRTAAIAFIGRLFRDLLELEEGMSNDLDTGHSFLRRFILVHLSVGSYQAPNEALDKAKADMLIHLIRKLVATMSGEITVDDADALSHQSVLLPGYLYLAYLKDRLEAVVETVARVIRRQVSKAVEKKQYSRDCVEEIVNEAFSSSLIRSSIGERMVYMLATGNVMADSNLDLPQNVGYSVLAERINYLRFLAHFRCVHRGAFYAQMRSTKVRKLLPEAWGFICPVHTPDGDPCGILNHLASPVRVTQGGPANADDLIELFSDFGIIGAPSLNDLSVASPPNSFPVVLDGRVVGYIPTELAENFTVQLRCAKHFKSIKALPDTAEIVHIARTSKGRGFYPGIYIYTVGGRLVRPVSWLCSARKRRRSEKSSEAKEDKLEWIGTLEQVFLSVRLYSADQEHSLVPTNVKGATHAEISPASFLSVVASLSPFPDMNQGPRNMFQCQMAKQAMGTPCHVFDKRTESKVYRLTCPQAPITRNKCMQDPMGADVFGNGVNAVVAVISYTGNDMEDALIINKGSLNRGFAHGTVYMNKKVDLETAVAARDTKLCPVTHKRQKGYGTIDEDGLPLVGSRLFNGMPIYGTVDRFAAHGDISAGKTRVSWTEHKSVENATVDSVIISDPSSFLLQSTKDANKNAGIRHATIRTRISRTPDVGDKFASRAGQKGTVAAAWPTEDMPFSESGMVPDILFNPNGFPSRMTIGMMVESMAGKGGALHGRFQDSTPFQFDEKNKALAHFADQLVKAGYNYHGNETLYSGYTGEPFEVEIFMGVVHYQRLRHMVSDKFQVRSTGKVHPLFRQPIKGRKRGGAIRFGEMERDGLLAHGCSFLLKDRLGTASDTHRLSVCEKCGSIVTPVVAMEGDDVINEGEVYCRACGKAESDRICRVIMPYSFKYLVNELVAMNIKTTFDLRPV